MGQNTIRRTSESTSNLGVNSQLETVKAKHGIVIIDWKVCVAQLAYVKSTGIPAAQNRHERKSNPFAEECQRQQPSLQQSISGRIIPALLGQYSYPNKVALTEMKARSQRVTCCHFAQELTTSLVRTLSL